MERICVLAIPDVLSADAVIVRRDDVQFISLDDELLAIDGDAGFCYSLNRTGGAVWQLLDRPATVAQLCASLERAYAVDGAACRHDLAALLCDMEQSGLVRIAAAGTA